MTPHLLAVEIGPVWEMIAAARKTRDLWFGSWLMSEVAKAAALAVAMAIDPVEGFRHLIFPAPGSFAELKPRSELTVADEIWAVLPANDPATVARAAKEAVHDAWLDHARKARSEFLRLRLLDDVAWLRQTREVVDPTAAGDVVECYAAWSPLGEGAAYGEVRQRVKRLLAGRTCCRNFPQADGLDGRRPKSSLDGARPTVLSKEAPAEGARKRLRLTAGEELDAPGLTKRHGGGDRPYPSVARIAADPWLRGAERHETEAFGRFAQTCGTLAENGDLVRLRPSDYPQFRAFPYEGGVVYENRHPELAEELTADLGDEPAVRNKAVQDALNGPLKPLREALATVRRVWRTPSPYYAVLVADGDGVGAALGRVNDAEGHRTFSQTLSRFAAQARTIIRDHHGAAVFVGGDDITAFLPVDRAVLCARTLRDTFRETLEPYATDGPITLSVGLAIAHFLEALEDVLAVARTAEHAAKNVAGKDALVVDYRPRGGAPVVCSASWSSFPERTLYGWTDLLRGELLPEKVAYDLRTLSRHYAPADGTRATGSLWHDAEALATALRGDAARLLSRKSATARKSIRPYLATLRTGGDLKALAETILIARRIADALDQAGEPVPFPLPEGSETTATPEPAREEVA